MPPAPQLGSQSATDTHGPRMVCTRSGSAETTQSPGCRYTPPERSRTLLRGRGPGARSLERERGVSGQELEHIAVGRAQAALLRQKAEHGDRAHDPRTVREGNAGGEARLRVRRGLGPREVPLAVQRGSTDGP